MGELERRATSVALRNGIVKASLLLVRTKVESESRLLATFIEYAAHYIEKLNNEEKADNVSDIKIGSIIRNRKFAHSLENGTGINTVGDLMRLPIPSGWIAEQKGETMRSLCEVLLAMQPRVIIRQNKRKA